MTKRDYFNFFICSQRDRTKEVCSVHALFCAQGPRPGWSVAAIGSESSGRPGPGCHVGGGRSLPWTCQGVIFLFLFPIVNIINCSVYTIIHLYIYIYIYILYIYIYILVLSNDYWFDGYRFYNRLPVSKFKNRWSYFTQFSSSCYATSPTTPVKAALPFVVDQREACRWTAYIIKDANCHSTSPVTPPVPSCLVAVALYDAATCGGHRLVD